MNTTSILQEIALKNAFSIYIPSLKKEIKFTPLTIAQQRAIYESASDNMAFQTKFVIATYNIIKANCLEPELVDSFNAIDRASILIDLRNNLFDTTMIEIEENLYDLTLVKEKLKITDCNIYKEKIAVGDLLFELQIPNILDWCVLEKDLRSGQEVPKTFVKIFSEVYITELIKLIKEIYYKSDNGEYVSVDFKSKSTEEKIQAISGLPAEASFAFKKALIDYYDYYMDLLTVNKEGDSEIKIIVDIRADFFIE